MDKKDFVRRAIMIIGFVIGGIGGASAAKKLPDELEEIKSEIRKAKSDPVADNQTEE